mgnify:CR=1 FL=1
MRSVPVPPAISSKRTRTIVEAPGATVFGSGGTRTIAKSSDESAVMPMPVRDSGLEPVLAMVIGAVVTCGAAWITL